MLHTSGLVEGHVLSGESEIADGLPREGVSS